MYPAGEPKVTARTVTLRSGLRIRIAESGARDHPPVLLLHGWGASLYMWRDWFAPVVAAGRRAIAIDLPGHGLSDKPSDRAAYRTSSMTDVLLELLDHEGIESADIVAQSMAGTIAMELALTHANRLRRLVLVNPSLFGRVRIQSFARLVSPPVIDVILPRLVARWLIARTHRMVFGDPSRITRRDEDEYWAPSQFPSYARAMRQLVHEFDWARPPVSTMVARLRSLRAPFLVVLGTRDRLVRGAAPYVSALRDAGAALEVEIVNGGGHAVNEERPEDVVPIALEFLCRA